MAHLGLHDEAMEDLDRENSESIQIMLKHNSVEAV